MYKWYQVLVQDLNENVDENLKDLEENLTWLTQKTEDPKGINGTLLSRHAHTVNVIELNCKVATPPHFCINPSFSGLFPLALSCKAFCTLPSISIFGRSYPPPPFNKGGTSDYVNQHGHLLQCMKSLAPEVIWFWNKGYNKKWSK